MQRNLDSTEIQPVSLDESDAFDGPWFAGCDTERWIEFDIDRTTTIVERVEPPFDVKSKDGKINQIRGFMRNIVYVDKHGGDVADDDEHTAPFWCGKGLKKAFKASNSKKWITLRFKRTAEEEIDSKGQVVKTINTAEFELVD